MGKISGTFLTGIISGVIGIIGGAVAIWSAYHQWQEKNKSDEDAANSRKEAQQFQNKLNERTEELLLSNKKLEEASEKNNSLQTKMIEWVTGGNNVPCLQLIITPIRLDERTGLEFYLVRFIIENNGATPLHEVETKVKDHMGELPYRRGLSCRLLDDGNREMVGSPADPIREFELYPKSSINALLPSQSQEFYCTVKDIFPTLTEVFREIKKFDYKSLPILLQYLERYLIIDVICQRIHTLNDLIPLFTIHDSIVTTEEFVPLVEAVMLEELTAAIGYPPTLAIEAWQYENLK